MTVLRNAIHIAAPPERVRALRHHYQLTRERGGTRVEQTQEYTLKYGPLGAVLDALFVRRRWEAGVRSFFAGLKQYVEGRVVA